RPVTVQTVAAEPDVSALAAVIATFSLEQLVELKISASGEAERIQRAITEQPGLAAAAYERRDADRLLSAWEAEADLTRALAVERAREALLVSRLNELVTPEAQATQSALQQRL